MQQQMWPLKKLAERSIPEIPATPAAVPMPPPAEDALPNAASFLVEFRKALDLEDAA
jgi:hypothetical protein